MSYHFVKTAIIGASLLALLSACGQSKALVSGEQPAIPKQSQTSAPESQPAVKPAEQDNMKQAKVKVYYGDENGEKLVEQETTVTYQQEDGKYAAALKALSESPGGKQLALLKGIKILSANLKDQMLTVNLSIAPEGRLGSGGEALLLQAVQNTVFQFSEIHSLEILVDGKKVESLMGHMDLPHPIKRG
ncbi:GerMN domain-containing protein [Paenibacillus piri]|uniref:GerMN domain-containing protein n=1 Tax=Paenibacillus piri TaxID=2547395 RepID=A0A4R5KU30_9BACL|nr:GerMN domain-containing protein [Paenibacillus piri]TDF99391.1 hypothetical protein E1757_05925 [Paenibacillus piri]